jgi:uncharacterized alkaline shock family protein YloU
VRRSRASSATSPRSRSTSPRCTRAGRGRSAAARLSPARGRPGRSGVASPSLTASVPPPAATAANALLANAAALQRVSAALLTTFERVQGAYRARNARAESRQAALAATLARRAAGLVAAQPRLAAALAQAARSAGVRFTLAAADANRLATWRTASSPGPQALLSRLHLPAKALAAARAHALGPVGGSVVFPDFVAPPTRPRWRAPAPRGCEPSPPTSAGSPSSRSADRATAGAAAASNLDVEGGHAFTSALGRITISSDAIARIVGETALECYGIVGMVARGPLGRAPVQGPVRRLLGRDATTQGIAIGRRDGAVTIDLHVVVEYGLNLAEVASTVRNRVAYEVERLTGLAVGAVEVHVDDVRQGGA